MEVTKNGDYINWKVIITNNGGSGNTNVKFQDTIAPGLAYQSYTIGPPVKGTFNMSNGLWSIGSQAAGVSYQIVIKYKVVDISQATEESGVFGFALSGLVSGDNIDPNDINNIQSAFVEITTCPPSAGAVGEDPACLCGSVATNDTPCSHGTTEYRLTIGSLTNLDPSFTLDVETGDYNAMGKIIDPFQDASFTYAIWCLVDGNEFETSGPATVVIPALFPATFTDSVTDNGDGTVTHKALDGTEVTWNKGWTTVTEESGTDVLTFTYPNGDTMEVDLGAILYPGSTVFPSVINANISITNLTLRNFNKVNDSGAQNINIILPDPATLGFAANRTQAWVFKRINVNDGGTITLTPDNTKTIDGQASYVFAGTDYTSVLVWTDGDNYFLG